MAVRIGLLGMGKTGRVIAESIFEDRRFDLVFAVKRTAPRPIDYKYSVETREMLPQLIKKFRPNIIVDFTRPEATLENIKCLSRGMGIVIGTTGFEKEQLRELKKCGRKLRMLYAPNISSGINILMKACQVVYNLWRRSDPDIEIIEEHFSGKKDSPSGTAKKIAELFKGEIPIHSIRAGAITGEHKVLFVTKTQKIVLSHSSFSKQVFADGAKRAALWLNRRRRNRFYTMKDVYGGADIQGLK